jgi:hypothetical protein
MAGAGGVGGAQNHLRAFKDSEIRRRRPARLGPHRHHGRDESQGVERLAVPAAWWCSECGYLLPPSARERSHATDGDPMRREPVSDRFDAPCPGCAEHGWVDLGIVPLAMRIRDDESEALRTGRLRRSAIGGVLALGGALGLAALGVGSTLGLWIAPLVFASAFPMGLMEAMRADHAHRWHRPARRWSRGARLACGPATADPLIAPLSGRRAIAWVVAVRYAGGNPRRARRPTRNDDWALVEQRCAGLTIAGNRLDAEPVIDVTPELIVNRSAGAEEWLRTRGLELQEDLQLFEAIIPDGAMVELFRNKRGAAPILRETPP